MECLEDYCRFKPANSEQHVDLTKGKIDRSNLNISKFLYWSTEHDLFLEDRPLMSLSTGIIANEKINCHLAFKKGLKAIQSVVGKNASNISLFTIHKLKPLSMAQNAAHINGNFPKIDPYFLFQRISITLHVNTNKTQEALDNEISPIPLSLFDDQGLLRKSEKSKLYNIIE